MIVSLRFQISNTKENAMQQFIEKYKDQITGVLSGFDRLVFRGSLRRLHLWEMGRAVERTAGRGDGATCGKSDSVQGLRAACETGERTGEAE
jgi:hypothetical protein